MQPCVLILSRQRDPAGLRRGRNLVSCRRRARLPSCTGGSRVNVLHRHWSKTRLCRSSQMGASRRCGWVCPCRTRFGLPVRTRQGRSPGPRCSLHVVQNCRRGRRAPRRGTTDEPLDGHDGRTNPTGHSRRSRIEKLYADLLGSERLGFGRRLLASAALAAFWPTDLFLSPSGGFQVQVLALS